VADHLIDARAEDERQPQTNMRSCGQTRVSELDHRRLKASLLPLHDHRKSNSSRNRAEAGLCCTLVLTMDIRAIQSPRCGFLDCSSRREERRSQ
jgi:hypothetical protein